MRALVTGGAGFIGSHVVDALIDRGDDVVCVDDCSAPQNERFFFNDRAVNVRADIRDTGLREHYAGVDVVFHLAARSRIQPSVGDPSESFSVNVMGTQEVLEASRRAGVGRVVYAASSSYYGNRNTPPFTEDMPPGCATPYSLSKFQGEQICDLYTLLYGLSTVSLRYFNVYGPREPLRGEYAPVMGLFRRQVRDGLAMTVVGDGSQRRDFTYIADVVAANLLAAEHPEVTGALNIGTGVNYSIAELARMVGGPEAAVEYIGERVGETRVTLADATRAREALGWTAQYSLVDTITGY